MLSFNHTSVPLETPDHRGAGVLPVPDANTTAIEIATDNVTLDLNGFSILGPTVCSEFSWPTMCSNTGRGFGVNASGRSNITVVNGTVRGMGADGITGGNRSRIEKVNAIGNRAIGIGAGISSTVSGNTVSLNGSDGVWVNEESIVSGNTVTRNIGNGITAGVNTIVIGNLAVQNRGYGLNATGTTCYANNNFFPNRTGGVLYARKMGTASCPD